MFKAWGYPVVSSHLKNYHVPSLTFGSRGSSSISWGLCVRKGRTFLFCFTYNLGGVFVPRQPGTSSPHRQEHLSSLYFARQADTSCLGSFRRKTSRKRGFSSLGLPFGGSCDKQEGSNRLSKRWANRSQRDFCLISVTCAHPTDIYFLCLMTSSVS